MLISPAKNRAHRQERVRGTVRMLRHIGLAKRPRLRLPVQLSPRTIEREYAKALQAIVHDIRLAYQPIYDALPQLVALSQALRRVDAEDDRQFKGLIDRVSQDIRQRVRVPERVEAKAQEFGERTSRFQKSQLDRQIKAGLGTHVFVSDDKVGPVLEGFITENKYLAQSIEREILSDVEGLFTRGIRQGLGAKDIAKQMDDTFDLADGRAARIAKDQVLTLYGQVNAVRQQALGVERFTWRTVGDAAVRPEHELLDGEVFSYDEPPDEGLPGEAINCRCTAEPVLSDILDGE